jgi:hypothetical protein
MYSYFYPGMDVSFIVTEFLPTIKGKILSYAKLRAGINKNGNDNLGSASTIYGWIQVILLLRVSLMVTLWE